MTLKTSFLVCTEHESVFAEPSNNRYFILGVIMVAATASHRKG